MKASVYPLLSLSASLFMLLAALGTIAFCFLNGTRIAYDSSVAPTFGLGLIVGSFVAVSISIWAVAVKAGWLTISSLLIAILGVVVSAAALFLILAVMLANHPV